jgi:hypothetical protein
LLNPAVFAALLVNGSQRHFAVFSYQLAKSAVLLEIT